MRRAQPLVQQGECYFVLHSIQVRRKEDALLAPHIHSCCSRKIENVEIGTRWVVELGGSLGTQNVHNMAQRNAKAPKQTAHLLPQTSETKQRLCVRQTHSPELAAKSHGASRPDFLTKLEMERNRIEKFANLIIFYNK